MRTSRKRLHHKTSRSVKRKQKNIRFIEKFQAKLSPLPKDLLVGGIFIIVGILFISAPPLVHTVQKYFSHYQQEHITQKKQAGTITTPNSPIRIDEKLLSSKEMTQPPLRVVIPDHEIDIPIVEAPVQDGYWELSETTASHGVGSASPGESGNMVIFAHAREGLFLPLRSIKPDTIVYILTKDRWFRYRVTKTQEVEPNDTTVIAPTTEETLTLFTCTGFLDNKRMIVTAVPYRP